MTTDETQPGFCFNCGQQLSGDATFCSRCGENQHSEAGHVDAKDETEPRGAVPRMHFAQNVPTFLLAHRTSVRVALLTTAACVIGIYAFRWFVLDLPNWLSTPLLVGAYTAGVFRLRTLTIVYALQFFGLGVVLSVIARPAVWALAQTAYGYKPGYELSLRVFLFSFGAVTIALLLRAYIDADWRARLRGAVLPHGAVDPLRAVVASALVLAALVPVWNIFSTPRGFSKLVTHDSRINAAISEHYGYKVTGCSSDGDAEEISELIDNGGFFVCDDGITATIDFDDGTVYGGE